MPLATASVYASGGVAPGSGAPVAVAAQAAKRQAAPAAEWRRASDFRETPPHCRESLMHAQQTREDSSFITLVRSVRSFVFGPAVGGLRAEGRGGPEPHGRAGTGTTVARRAVGGSHRNAQQRASSRSDALRLPAGHSASRSVALAARAHGVQNVCSSRSCCVQRANVLGWH